MAQGVYERVKAKRDAASKGQFSSVYDRVNATRAYSNIGDINKQLELLQTKIDQTYDSFKTRFYDENGNFVDSYRGDTEHAYNSFAPGISELNSEIKAMSSYLNDYGKYLNPEYVSSVKNYLSGSSKSLGDMYNAYESDNKFWSQFPTEADYHGWVATDETMEYDAEGNAKRTGAYGELTKRIEELNAAIENFEFEKKSELVWVMNTQTNIPYPSYQTSNANQAEYDALVAERDRLAAYDNNYNRINAVYAEIENYQKTPDFSNWAAQGETMGVADYWDAYKYYANYDKEVEKISTDQNMTNAEKAAALNALNAKAPKAVNKLATYRHFMENYYTDDVNSTNPNREFYEGVFSQVETFSNNEVAFVILNGLENNWDKITNEEYQVYCAKLASEGEGAAEEYLKGLQRVINKRASKELSEQNAAAYNEADWLGKVFLNVASVPANIFGGMGSFVSDAADYITKGEIDPYSNAHALQQFATDIRYHTATDIDNATGNFELLKISLGDAYQAAMSGVDSIVGAYALGGAYTYVMGMGAASAEAKRLYEQGASNEQIAAGGLLAGATEMIFEKVSIDRFLDKFVNAPTMTARQALVQTLLQGFTEASEEAATEIVNTISNAIVMGSQSDWEQAIAKYKNEGCGDSEAISRAFFDVCGNVWEAAAGGFISGGMMGGGGTLINLAGNKINQSNAIKQDGANIVGNNNLETLLAAARNLPNTKANAKIKALAEGMSGIDTTKLSKSESEALSKRVGKLYSLIQNAQASKLSTSKSDAAKSIITEKLNALGIENKSDISKATEAIFNTVYKGKKLSSAEAKLLDRIGATKVVNELLNESSDVNAEAIKSWDRAKGQLRETQSLTNKTDSRTIDTSSYSLSDDGKTYIKGTDEAVSITGIQSIKNGDIKVNLSNGKTESISNIDLGSQDDAVIYQGILDMGVDSATASLIVKSFEKGTDATSYIYGVQDAIKYGKIGGKAYVNSGVFTSKLTDKQRSDFYRVGEMVTEREAKNKAKAIENAKKDNKVKGKVVGSVSFDGVDRNSLNERQKVTVDAIEAAFGEMGINVVFFQSPVNAQGEHIGENGSYDPETNTIRLDISAGLKNQDTILFTAAHELTHFIAEWSDTKFKTFADFLVKNYAKHGISVNDLVQAKIEMSKNSKTYNKPLTYEEAFEEVVADSCESFLRDSDLMTKLTELAKKDMTLFERIKDYIDGLFDRLKKAYAGLTPDSLEANEVLAMKDCIGELRKMWVEAAMEARENFQAAGGKALKNTTSEGGVKFELREYSQHQIDNWKNSKKIVLYENETQFRNFIKESQTNKQYHKKLYFGAIPSDFAQFIFENTAVDVEGYNCSLSSDEIRKIFKDHGTEETEAPRGQRAITDDDIVNILLVLQSPEVVARSEKDYMGKPVINMSKHIDGKMTISAVVSDKHLDLFVQTAFVGIKKGNLVTPIAEQAAINTPKASSDTVSKDSIPQSSKKSQEKKSDRDTLGNILTEAQLDYFAESKVRDENGNLKVMYHGTPNATFTKFRPGTYFTEHKWYADNYQNQGASSLSYKKTADNPDTYAVYLNIKKPFDTRNKAERDIFYNEYYRQWGTGTDLMESGLPDWLDGQDLQEFLEEKGYDYDGLILDEGATGGYGDEIISRGVSYVTFKPEQVKSVDNKTPTDNPDYRFSMRQNVEETRDLVAVHNLSEEKLLKSLQLGGLPMPSIAIARAKEGHSNFGKISLVFRKDTIDPQSNRNNKVYSGDAWTPTYPSIEYKPNEKIAENISDKYYELYKEIGSDAVRPMYRYMYDMSDILNRYGGESALLEKLYADTDMKQLYSKISNDNTTDGYKVWIDNLFKGIEEKEGIRNKTDLFTPSGNLRKFEALHYEHNLENVIKAMKESGEKGIGTFGRGNIFGASATEYQTISDIKDAAETRLQNISQEEYDAIRNGFSERFFELAGSLPIHKDSFIATDAAANMLIEAVVKFKTKSGMANYLRSESKGWANYSDYIVDDLIQLVSEIRQMPVGYFEAKPQRAVGFDEVATAIIPDNSSAELKTKLTDNGVEFVEYQSGNEESRLEALNSIENVKFSDRVSYAPTFYSYMGKTIGEMKQDKIGASSVVPYLKGKGVKNEEIKWSGIETFLEGKKSVTKAELQEFAAGSMLQIEENGLKISKIDELDKKFKEYTGDSLSDLYDDMYKFSAKSFLETLVYSYAEYGFVNKEQYRELENLANKIEESRPRWQEYKLNGGTNYREITFKLPNASYSNQMMRVHWGDNAQGILAHARIQDFETDNGKMLFIEEIQSDWHNAGQKQGYIDKSLEVTTKTTTVKHKNGAYRLYRGEQELYAHVLDSVLETRFPNGITEKQIHQGLVDEHNSMLSGTVPDAPFSNNYHEYVLKSLIRMAAEEGYDSIGWTTADIQSERWSDEFAEGYHIEYDQDIPKFLNKYGKKWDAKVSKIALNNESDTAVYVDNNGKEYKNTREWYDSVMDSYSEKDLTIWNDYLAGLTKIIQKGNTMRIQLKKTGKLLDEALTVSYTPDTVWSMNLTDSMKNSVLHEGQVMYQARPTESMETYEKINKQLAKENVKLIEDVKYLKELVRLQGTLTHNKIMKKSTIELVAKRLMKYASAKGNVSELVEHLSTVYGYIIQGEDVSWEGIKEKSYDAVQWLKDHEYHTPVRDEYADKILNDLRTRRIKLDDLQKKEISYQYGSYNDYRKRMMGKVVISNDGLSLDSAWQELSNMYPMYFDSEVNSNDQPAELLNIITDLQNSYFNEYEFEDEMITQELYNKVYDGYWDVSHIHTVADAKQKEINLLKSKHYEKMSDLRQSHNEKVAQLKKEHKDKITRIRQEYREGLDKRMEAIKQQYQESRQKEVEGRHRTELRNKIKRVVNDLNQYLLKGTKDKHVMIGLQKSVAMALDAVNMDTVGADERVAKYNALIAKATDPDVKASLTETRDRIQQMGDRMNDKLDKLKSAYEEIKNSDDPDVANAYDEVIENAINSVIADIGETSLRDMTYTQLESVYDLYTMILTRVRGANESFKSAKNENIKIRGSRVTTEVERTGGNHPLSIKALGAVKGFAWNTLKPTYAFETIGSETLTEAFENVRSGEDTWATDVNEAKDYYKEKTDKYGFDSWDFKTRHTFKSTSGISFELSLEQIMSLYAYSKRKQAGLHLQYGGFVFDDSIEVVEKKHGVPIKYNVKTANAHNLSPETLSAIIGTLTTEQKSFVDEMQEYLSVVMGAKGNEVSLAMYGVKLFKEKFYFPLKSAKQFLFEQNQTAGEVRIKNAGFTKDVVPEAKNPVILSNFTDVWSNHVNDMAMYHSFVLALEDFNRIFNYKTPVDENIATNSVKSAIQNAYGKQANDYIKQLLTDLNGGARVDSATGFLNKTIGMFKKASVFASASVVVQQPSAIGRAFAIIDPKYFATNPGIKGHKDLWEEVKKYAPVAIIKEMGYFDTHVGKQTTDWIKAKEYKTIGEKAKALFTDSGYRDDILSKAPALADELTWSYIWQAVKKEVAATTKLKVGSEEYLQRCGERFTEVITKTQVYDSVLARSGMMRSNDTGMKMVTAFMAEPTTSLNMLTNALVQGKRGNKRYARKAIGGVVTSMVLNSILVAFVYAARDDDDDETYVEKYISAFSGQMVDSINPLTLIPWVKDMWSIIQGYDVERSDMSVVSDLWNAFSDLSKSSKSPYQKVENFVGSICTMFGLPVKNIMRDARSIYNVVDTFMNGGQTTWYGIEDAIIEGVTGDDVSLMERAERAMSRGDSRTFEKTVSEMIQAKVDAGKTEKEAKSAVRSSFTSRYKKQYVEAAQKHNSAEMTRIRKLLYQTGVYGTLSELDETLKKWRTE